MTRVYPAAAALAVSLFAAAGTTTAGSVVDRLDRFRELVSGRLGAAHVLDDPAARDTYREVYALLDEEIVESLNSGGVFASTAFLQDRLDGFSDAWGGAAARIVRLGPLTVGVFQLGERTAGNSVRVYGRLRDEVALLTATARDGRPTLFPLAPGPGGAVQFLVAWDEAPSGIGARPVRLDVMRQHADGVRVVWSTADIYPDTLMAREYTVRGSELRVRYQLRYPGWVPGCEGQTEQEDVLRLTPATGTYTRVAQRSFDGWHRELRAAATQLFAAVATSDRRTLTALVPDVKVRERLPRKLESEPVCDAPSGTRGEQVAVAASDGDGAPWTLLFQRDGCRWRVNAALRVIP
jgi:hypothetical protein